MCKINLSKPYCFSAYMSGSSSPSTSSATTIYQLSSLPPPSTLSDASIDTDLLKPPGEHRAHVTVCGSNLSSSRFVSEL